jgi:ABC-type uncharacterized transport system involved in gliding motility auxiliary subunit
MKSKSNFYALYKSALFKLAIHPATYFVCIIMVLFTVLQFFLGQQFFTDTGSTDLRHFFSAIPYICIVALPTLAIQLHYDEVELQYPVAPFTIPFAQFCAMLTVAVGAILLTVIVPISIHFFGDVELSQAICGYIGILFYLACSISLTVFFTTIAKSAGASFIINTFILAAVNSAHLIALYVTLPNTLSSIVKSISFAWHFDAAGKGIIDTRDIVFYIIVTASFILLSGVVIQLRRGRAFSYNNKANSFFISVLLLGVLIASLGIIDSSLLYLRIDTTKGKRFSVTEYSRSLLSEIEEPLTITYYRSSTLQDLYPQVRDVKDYLVEYHSINDKINLITIDPSKTSQTESKDISTKLEQYGIHAQQIQTASRDSTSYASVYSAIVIDYLEKTEVIPFVLDTSTLEYDLTSRIASLVRSTKREVQIVVGNNLSLQNDYSYVQPWLESQGFVVTQAALPSQQNKNYTAPVFTSLQKTPLLVIGTSSFTSEDTEALEQFTLNNGSVFIATTPYTVDIAGDWSVTPTSDKVSRLLNNWGLTFKNTLTADISNFRITLTSDTKSDGTPASSTSTEYVNYPLWPVLRPQTYALNGMTTFWPCAIDYSAGDNVVTPLLVTSSSSWQLESVDGKFETNPFAVPKASSGSEEKGPVTMAISVKGKLPGYYTTGYGNAGELVVFADQYAFSTLMLGYTAGNSGDFRSLDFLTDRLLELEGQGAILPLKNRNYISTSLYKISADERYRKQLPVILLNCGIPLLIIVLVALCFVLTRKKNNNRKREKQ